MRVTQLFRGFTGIATTLTCLIARGRVEGDGTAKW